MISIAIAATAFEVIATELRLDGAGDAPRVLAVGKRLI